jgi:hypothetical protein
VFERGFRHVQNGQRYLAKVKGIRNHDYYTYLLGGIGAVFFNPRSFYKNKWYSLQPLGTEGQGLNGHKKYSRITMVIPVGFGVKTKIMREHYLGLEFGYRITFTDYLDDVSGNYFSNSQILENRGPVAAHFADPSLSSAQKDLTMDGEQRGNSAHKDGYFFLSVTYSKQTSGRRRH